MAETKNAHEGVVTSIADTDLVMVVGPQGGLHPISFANLAKLVRNTIQIGGRNLIPNSAKLTGWSPKTGGLSSDGSFGVFSVRKSEGAFKGIYKVMSFAEGNDYTFSVYANSLSVAVYLPYVAAVVPESATATATFGPSVRSVRSIGEGWYQISAIAKCTKSGSAVIEFESTVGDYIRYCAPKLEIGNVVTDWSPAPEDFASAWVGVIGYLPITYKIEEKGGAHEPDEDTGKCNCLVADGHLSFESFDDLIDFCGHIEEIVSVVSCPTDSYVQRCGSGDSWMDADNDFYSQSSNKGPWWIPSDASIRCDCENTVFLCLEPCHLCEEAYFRNIQRPLGALDESHDDSNIIAERKEVAYAD